MAMQQNHSLNAIEENNRSRRRRDRHAELRTATSQREQAIRRLSGLFQRADPVPIA